MYIEILPTKEKCDFCKRENTESNIIIESAERGVIWIRVCKECINEVFNDEKNIHKEY